MADPLAKIKFNLCHYPGMFSEAERLSLLATLHVGDEVERLRSAVAELREKLERSEHGGA